MAHSNSGMRLAVLGAGKMGGILIEAFVKHRLVPAQNIFATVQHPSRERKNGAALGVGLSSDNRAAVKNVTWFSCASSRKRWRKWWTKSAIA